MSETSGTPSSALAKTGGDNMALVANKIGVETQDVALFVTTKIEAALRIQERAARLQVDAKKKLVEQRLRAFWRKTRAAIEKVYRRKFERVLSVLREEFPTHFQIDAAVPDSLAPFGVNVPEKDVAALLKAKHLTVILTGLVHSGYNNSTEVAVALSETDQAELRDILKEALAHEKLKKGLFCIRGHLADVDALERHARATIARHRLEQAGEEGKALVEKLDSSVAAISDNLTAELRTVVGDDALTTLLTTPGAEPQKVPEVDDVIEDADGE